MPDFRYARSMPMDVFQKYKPIRNEIALLERSDALRVIWAYCQYLQVDEFKIPADIEVHKILLSMDMPQTWVSEWTLELLAKEVLLNSGGSAKKGRTLRNWKTFSEILNAIRDIENEIYGALGGKNILVEMIRIAHRQFIWQSNRPNSGAIIRYYKIFNRNGIDKICIDRLGLSVTEIYACYLGCAGHFLGRYELMMPLKSDIKKLPPEKFEKFFSFTSKSLSEIKPILKAEQKYDVDFAYAYTSLRAYPLVRTQVNEHEVLACPLPTLLFWRITGGLYYELIADPLFANEFGDSIQAYVGDVLESACPSSKMEVLSEKEYSVGKIQKRSIDWIAADDTAALFIECKAKRLSWAAKVALHDLSFLEADINSMADAVVQTYKTIVDCQLGKYEHFSLKQNQKVYPLIVTLENWHMFGPIMIQKLNDAVVVKMEKDNLPKTMISDMPYSIWAIEEFEAGMQIMNETPISKFMDGKVCDKEMCQWEWRPYMTKQFPKFPYRDLFDDEYQKLGNEIIEENAA